MYQLTEAELRPQAASDDVVYRTVVVGRLACNCTVLGNKRTKEVVPPGGRCSVQFWTADKWGLTSRCAYDPRVSCRRGRREVTGPGGRPGGRCGVHPGGPARARL